MDDHPRAATPRSHAAVNGVLGLFGAEPVPLLFSSFAVLVCLVYVHLPFMVLPLYANLEKHDQALLDAAQDLGANAWQRFWRITFPLSLPGVYAGAALVFIPALGIFAIPDILGGPDDSLIGNVIKQQFLETRDWPFGSVLSIVLTRRGAGCWRDWRLWVGATAARLERRRRAHVRKRSYLAVGSGDRGYAFLYVPLVIVVVYSFNDSRLNAEWVGFTLDWYRKLVHNDEMPDGRGQFAADRLVREPRLHGAGNDGRRRDAPVPACDCCRCSCWPRSRSRKS